MTRISMTCQKCGAEFHDDSYFAHAETCKGEKKVNEANESSN